MAGADPVADAEGQCLPMARDGGDRADHDALVVGSEPAVILYAPGIRRLRQPLQEDLEVGREASVGATGEPPHHATWLGSVDSGAGSVSLTSAIDTDGMSRMKPRNSRKKKPKLPMVRVLSTRAGTKMPQV